MTPTSSSLALNVVATETNQIPHRRRHRSASFARRAECQASRKSSRAPDRSHRGSLGRRFLPSGPRSNRRPGNRSVDNGLAPSWAPSWFASAKRRKPQLQHPRGLILFFEMNRTISSDKPFGAKSLSISVTNPYLYFWSANSCKASALGSCQIPDVEIQRHCHAVRHCKGFACLRVTASNFVTFTTAQAPHRR